MTSTSTALSATAQIGKNVTIKGEILSREDLYIEGNVEGTIEVPEHKLIVGTHGRVKTGTLRAREVVILGDVQGDVNAQERLEIRKEGRLVGNILTGRIQVEDGAHFQGQVTVVKPAPAEQPQPQVSRGMAAAPAAPAPGRV